MTTAEEIFEHVKALPEPVAREVLHFIEFLEQKYPRDASLDGVSTQEWLNGAWGCSPDFPDRLPDPPPRSAEPL